MSEPTGSTPPAPVSGWQPPSPVAGPAPGFEFGGPGARLVAYIIDVVITGVVILLLSLLIALLAVTVPVLIFLPIIAIILIPLVYFPYYWSRDGQTPGMQIMGIKVVADLDGGPVTVGMAILRYIGYIISAAVFYIGFIWIFIDKRQRGWHDLIGGTVVIKVPGAR